MASWLLKTEPSSYSFADLCRDRRTVWDGVKNPSALKHMRQIRKGDSLLIYHTGDVKAVVGTAKALSAAYPDPQKNDDRLVVFDLAAAAALPRPVSLAEVKSHAMLRSWELARLPRLSVMPVSREQWEEILRLSRQSS